VPAVTALLLVCGTALLIMAHSWKRVLRVAGVGVIGTRMLQPSEIVNASGIARGSRLFSVDLAAVRRKVEQNPYIRTASVQRDAPNRITITVEEREPIAIVAGSRMLYLDTAGYVLPATRTGQALDLPLITCVPPAPDFVPGKQVAADGVRQALAVLKMAQKIGGESYHRISEIRVDGEHDLLFYTAEYGIPVLIGHGDEAAKLLALDGFWKDVVRHRGARGLEYVDLRFEDQVVVRWAPDRTTGVQ